MKISDSFEFDGIKAFRFGYVPFGKPKMYIHTYWVDGLLIDTAQSNMQTEVLNTLMPLPIQQIYLTHHHEDHSGNIVTLQKQFNCPVYASTKCKALMQQPPKISFVQHITWGKSPSFNLIQAKDNFIKTDQHHFKIIAAPGHATDMVCLLEAEKGWLFSADLWVANRIKYFMEPESMKQQIKSIQNILQYDFDALFCAHNPQLKNGKVCLQNKLVFLQEFYEQASKLYHQGYTEKAIFKAMQLKENKIIWLLSGGYLSAMNMVRSVIRDELRNSKS